METAEFKRASHAVWEAMAPGWDEQHHYIEERARPVTELMLELLAPGLIVDGHEHIYDLPAWDAFWS